MVSLDEQRVDAFHTAMQERVSDTRATMVMLPASRLDVDDAFRHLDGDARARLLAAGDRRVAQPGEVLLRQGARRVGLWVVVDGEVEVVCGVAVRDTQAVARLGPGAVVGEMSFLRSAPASAHVIAATQCEVIAISGEAVLTVLDRDPGLAAQLYRSLAAVLAERLELTSGALLDLLAAPRPVTTTTTMTGAAPEPDMLRVMSRDAALFASSS